MTPKNKAEERLPGALPEIRHKTAVSTIRSTAEKATRDRSKHRVEENKKKVPQYKDFTQVSTPSVNTMRNKRETVTHRLTTANIKKYRIEKH
ncbi:hypothetical protein WA026_006878 [Henosepilachna vigintioctopunctata]|uniref:Uncharacterized protein n=1 Tax=Henosepilachna vigintioctopunctata TaxID=420089 RepID=A0AAW1V8Q1_9CUCU